MIINGTNLKNEAMYFQTVADLEMYEWIMFQLLWIVDVVDCRQLMNRLIAWHKN